jgi:ABC-2 type transport system permease protein
LAEHESLSNPSSPSVGAHALPPLGGIARYLKVYGVQIKNNFVREAVYRTNFLTGLVVDVVWMAVELSLFSVIYANVETFAGWNKEQVFFFLGIFFASDAIFTTCFQRNFWEFSDLVNQGELDILLTKPIHPLFLALTRYINLTNIFNFILGLSIAVYYSGPAGFEGGWRWLLVPFWLLIGCFIALLLRFLFSIWVFWTERSWAMSRLYYQFFAVATKPDTLFPPMVRYLILTILPFAFIGSVPARAVLKGLETWEYALTAGVIVTFFSLNAFLWKRGLSRYQSASS